MASPYYEMGAEYRGSVFTPGVILDAMVSIDNAVSELGRDIASDAQIDDRTRSAYASFWREWEQFYAANKGWGSRMLNETAGKVQEYQRRLDAWRKKFAALGGKLTAPGLIPPPPRLSKLPIILGIAAIGGGVVYLATRNRK